MIYSTSIMNQSLDGVSAIFLRKRKRKVLVLLGQLQIYSAVETNRAVYCGYSTELGET